MIMAAAPEPTSGPYADTYGIYADDLHWPGVLPVGFDKDRPPQPRRKASPPTGYTGDDGAWPTSDLLDQWAAHHAQLNVGLRLPSDIVGLDVDHYLSAKTGEIKQGADLLARLEHEHGPLPPTWRSTSRGADNPSGVRLYRVPAGTRLQTMVPGGIELIQRHHRYLVCWPSIHPDPDEQGRPRTYRWYTPDGEPADQPPAYDADDIPDLPWEWIEALTANPAPAPANNAPAAPQTANPDNWSPKVTDAYNTGVLRLRAAQTGGRHDTATSLAMGLCRLEQLGSRGATTALHDLGEAFIDIVGPDRADHGRDNGHQIAAREWDDIVRSGRVKAQTTTSTALTAPDPVLELIGTPATLQPAQHTPAGDTGDDYAPKWASLIIDGKTWLTSGPDTAQPLWGTEHTILAALDQPTTIAGPQGAGKSVFGQRLALGWIGLDTHILGLPIQPGDGNVLYLASDRPDQARLSMRRMVTDNELDTLEARMRVWKGPPPEDVAKQPLMLLQMAEVAQATFLIIDSVKDVALKLSADEVGAAYNSALQHCVAAGIQIIALHHPRKLSGETRDNPVRVLDDLYGAYWITAGNGSVIYLQPGEFDSYTLVQLKSPNGTKAEIPYEHVITTGDLQPPTAPDITSILEEAGYAGCAAAHVARCLYKVDDPTETQKRNVRRHLGELAEDGIAERVGKGPTAKWRLTE